MKTTTLPLLGALLLAGGAHAQTIQDDLTLFAVPPQPIPPGTQLPATPTSLTVNLSAAPLKVIQGAGGVRLRETVKDHGTQGQSANGAEGSPDLTWRLVDVLVPFDADLSTLDINVTNLQTSSAGNFANVLPVGTNATTNEQTLDEQVWHEEGITLDAQGRNTAIYQQNGMFPVRPVRVVGTGQLRQFRYVRLAYAPYRWNPTTGALTRTQSLAFTLSWERAQVNVPQALFELSDPIYLMDEDLADRFYNMSSMAAWYVLTNVFRRDVAYDFVIVTPQATRSGSTQLDAFVAHKESLGFNPVVISTEAIDLYYTGSEKADRIRNFLRDKYNEWGIEFVMMVGDGDPYDVYESETGSAIGTVPMKMAWPRGDGYESKFDGEACPTDHYYGDLTAEWDVDGDGYAAAFDDDYVSRTESYHSGGMDYTLHYKEYGVDFDLEVRVGRLHSDNITDIDTVLERTINYESRDLSTDPQPDRERVYLAMSHFSDDTDYAYLGRDIQGDWLAGFGLTSIRLYEPHSALSHDIDLEAEALINEWTSRGAGIVIWAGHGSEFRAEIRGDKSDLMSTAHTLSLDHEPRSFIFQGSCQNAWPEYTYNLAWELVEDGSMVTIAGTRNSWWAHAQTDFGSSNNIGDIGYWVARSYADEWRAGTAVRYFRRKIDPFTSETRLQNALTYNLYGDPSLPFKF